MMKSQCDRILSYMKQYGSISQYQGFNHLGITCTSQRVTDLRKRGYNVLTRYITKPSGARYARWSLGKAKK